MNEIKRRRWAAPGPAWDDQRAAVIIPARLETLREKEWLRELCRRQSPAANLGDLAPKLAEQTGLDHETTLRLLAEFAAQSASAR